MKDELAKNICRYRKEKGLTQEELAKMLGITFQAVSKWETAHCLLINDRISTKFRQRAATYNLIAEAIAAAVEHKEGNYLVYFQSRPFRYLQRTHRYIPRSKLLVHQCYLPLDLGLFRGRLPVSFSVIIISSSGTVLYFSNFF